MFEKAWNFAILCGLAIFLGSRTARSSTGSSPFDFQNVTVDKLVYEGCCLSNVSLKWQVTPFNATRALSFKIWLTRDGKYIRNVSILKPQTRNMKSFQYSFVRLFPEYNYVAHIEGYNAMLKNVTSYANFSFDVLRKVMPKDEFQATVSGGQGYLNVTWTVLEKYRRSSAPITYTINLCSRKDKPRLCAYGVTTVCEATYYYNASARKSVGQIQLYEQNWRKFVGKQNADPLHGLWDRNSYRFTCAIFLNVCTSKISIDQPLQYIVDYGNGVNPKPKFYRAELKQGISYEPEFIHIGNYTRDKNNPNLFAVDVHWRYRIVCAREPPKTLRIVLSSHGKTIFKEESVPLEWNPGDTNEYVERTIILPKLPSFSKSKLTFTTTDRQQNNSKTVCRDVITPEGAPVESPAIQPIVDGVTDCIGNKRNVTVRWTLPAFKDWKGYLRNMTLKYYEKETYVREIILPNVTSYTIFGLNCSATYKVQVRACNQVNELCSKYSETGIIEAPGPNAGPHKASGDDIIIGGVVGGGFGVVILACLVAYLYLRQRKPPLSKVAQLTEDVGNRYEGANKNELSEVGDYSKLADHMADENTVG